MILATLRGFYHSESGSVSLDFIVLAGLVLSFGITVATFVIAGVNPIASEINAVMNPATEFSAKFVRVDD